MLDCFSMRVLIIFPGALGDLICLGPAIRAIARRSPNDMIELMARAELARFAAGRMGIATGHSIDRREVSTLFRAEGEADPSTRAFFEQFRRIYSFFAADDADFRRALAAATPGEVSFHPFRPPGDGHIAQLYLDSVDGADEAIESRIDFTPSDLDSAQRLLQKLEIARGKFLLIFPGSGSAAKNWPLDRFIQVAAATSSILGPVVILGPAEAGTERVFRERRVATLTNLGLEVVAALAQLSAGFIGNDSGVSHLAAASGARGVVIFGPTDPGRWAPIGKMAILRRHPLEELPVGEVLNILHSHLVS